MKNILFFSLFFSILLFVIPNKARSQSNLSIRYRKPFFAYLGLENNSKHAIEPAWLEKMESLIRYRVELPRFRYLKLRYKSADIDHFVKKMVKLVVARSEGLAKMRAEWNSQFQGYDITTELLKSIHNRSFFYWLEIIKAKRTYKRIIAIVEKEKKVSENVNGEIVTKTIIKKVKKIIHIFSYTIQLKMHIHKLHIFDCRDENRRLSFAHKEACVHKKNHQYAGIETIFKTLTMQSQNETKIEGKKGKEQAENTYQQLFLTASRIIGWRIKNRLIRLKAFKLKAEISHTKGDTLFFPLGKNEGLQLNQGFYVYARHLNGGLIYKGYMKIRSIGDNRMKLVGHDKMRVDNKTDFYSTAQTIISTDMKGLNKGMVAFEHPMFGFSLGFYFSMIPFSFENNTGWLAPSSSISLDNDGDKQTFLTPAIRIAFTWDISNAIKNSEVYFDMTWELTGFSDAEEKFSTFGGFLWLGLFKKFHLRQLVISFGLSTGFGLMNFDSIQIEKDSNFWLGIEVMGGIEYFFAPSFSLVLRGGYRATFSWGDSIGASGLWGTTGMLFTF